MRREYNLPNCNLTIEGLGNESNLHSQRNDSRPLISTLMEFECQFMGLNKSFNLKGGKAFFEALLKEVNRYTQGFLSGINHPLESLDHQIHIFLEAIPEKNLHRLRVESTETGKEAIILDLNTIQLFDLVETLDQLLADPQTLPDLIFELKPLSRRYRIAEQSFGRQATPATLGIASLAVASLALFFLVPVPPEEVKQPSRNGTNPTEEVSENGENGENGENPNLISPEEVKTILAEAPEIEDPTELNFIQRYLYRTINDVWQNRDQVSDRLEFSVTVTKDGSIIDYKALEGTPEDGDQQTPLADLRYLPTRGGEINKEAIAVFKVVFNNSILEINPLQGTPEQSSFGTEIKNKNQLKQLTIKLRNTLIANFKENQKFSATLEFRVGMTENGEIGDYEAINQKAINYEDETPLGDLLNLEAVGVIPGGSLVPQKPLGQFKVVFHPDGKLEVSPWRGY